MKIEKQKYKNGNWLYYYISSGGSGNWLMKHGSHTNYYCIGYCYHDQLKGFWLMKKINL